MGNNGKDGKQGFGRGKGTASERNWSKMGKGSRLQNAGKKQADGRRKANEAGRKIDEQFGFRTLAEGDKCLGWLLNMLPTSVEDTEGVERSGVDLYFFQQDGTNFRATLFYEPYFYVGVNEKYAMEVAAMLHRRFAENVSSITVAEKEDLDLPNHLSGKKGVFLKFSFRTVAELMDVRSVISPVVARNKARAKANEAYMGTDESSELPDDILDTLMDIREYDVPYYVRTSIDKDLRVGAWYSVCMEQGEVSVERQTEMVEKAEPRVLAFDIECTKAPLKFPDASVDQIFMISYMVDRQGYLIINREIVSEDIDDFEYTPLPNYPGPFTIFNEKDEQALIRRFFDHIQEIKPHILVTYNGDFFDWPFLETRAILYDMNMETEIGFKGVQSGGATEYRGRCAVHLDCFYWVKRDSYLPQGSQGLKAVTKYKLGYDPVEVDPEDMVRFAAEQPAHMASYSVSDAVATFYLYDKYVHLFIFSLCTIIPMGAEDVLRKGSGTLCEALLMVEAFRGDIICPNKQQDAPLKFHDKHLLESETYIGGHVECLESGVFRSDLKAKFKLDSSAFDELIANVDRDLTFAIEVEGNIERNDITNYDEVRAEIVEKLEMLRDRPVREEFPFIYHLDVAAMYPNIILTNRLQPCSIVDQTICASCDHNRPESRCQRNMEWVWRGDYYPAGYSEYDTIKAQLEVETVDSIPFHELSISDQKKEIKKRLKTYCQKVYKKVKESTEMKKVDTICMRENPFYVNTVRAFRDRRYDYKMLTKTWKKKEAAAAKTGDSLAVNEAQAKALVYDSLQLAHKCILNSFYGYVMRKGARWHSMEMAGIVTNTGAALIRGARELVERVGRPLELDTDGIWCILPGSFPENFSFTTAGGGKIPISYPCVMLNADVHEKYTNDQYQELTPEGTYRTYSECSIFFEVDGPYRCMVLPASTEEGRLLKKRYAVFNHDGSLAELKGFELKRRGELQLIKIFQSQVFELFLKGSTLEECYQAVAQSANHWLDVLESKGRDLSDEELMDLISESRSMSRSLADYGAQKSTAISTAKRLGEFLGPEMVKDAGVSCKLIIANRPPGSPVTERAIPTVIFSAEPSVKRHYLRRWLKDPGMTDFDVRAILDWDYYINRLSGTIQKIITIPAALQKVSNPAPRVPHPDWLARAIRDREDTFRQSSLKQMFKSVSREERQHQAMMDIEDIGRKGVGGASASLKRPLVHRRIAAQPEGTGQSTLSFGAQTVKDQSVHTLEQEEYGEEASGEGQGTLSLSVRREEDYAGWLRGRKAKWRQLREQRQLRRQKRRAEGLLVATSGGVATAGVQRQHWDSASLPSGLRGAGVEGFLKGAALSLTSQFLQVLEVQPTEEPGSFKLWVLTPQGRMQNLPLVVNKVFYVNSSRTNAGFPGRQVDKMLPRSRRRMNLYEVHMSERLFQRKKKEISDIVSDPNVEGVYELQVPLVFRAIMNIGCVATVAQSRRERPPNARDPLLLEDLDYATAQRHPYLEESFANRFLRRIFLFYSIAKGGKGVVALFFLGGERTQTSAAEQSETRRSTARDEKVKAKVFFVNPMAGSDSLVPNLNRLYSRFLASQSSQAVDANAIPASGISSDPRNEGSTTVSGEAYSSSSSSSSSTNSMSSSGSFHRCRFSTEILRSEEEALLAVHRALTSYQSQSRGPTMVFAQTPLHASALRRAVPALAEFPVAVLQYNEDDRRLPAVGWQQTAAQRVIERFLGSTEWFQVMLACARYGNVPVGNIGNDFALSIADVFFARLLQRNQHLLWVSPGPKPDLGGHEADDNEAFVEEDETLRVVQQGNYRSVCVELDVSNLAVNTIMALDHINEIEGSAGEFGALMADSHASSAAAVNGIAPEDGREDEGAAEHSATLANILNKLSACMDDDGAIAPAFKLLRGMVTEWFKDAVYNDSTYADCLLQHFYRWIYSSSSLLHDPAILRVVHRMMQKVFLQLLAEIRRLGSKVVFATFSKIIICTPKLSLGAAKDYTEFLVRTITSRPLFSCLNLTSTVYWDSLLFMDDENYGGLQLRQVEGFGDEEGLHEENVENDSRTANQQDNMLLDLEDSDDEEGEEDKPISNKRRNASAKQNKSSENDPARGDADEKPYDLVSHWNIAEFLPETIQDLLTSLIATFILRPRDYRRKLMEKSQKFSASQSQSQYMSLSSQTDGFGDEGRKLSEREMREKEDAYLQNLIENHFTPKLLTIITEIRKFHTDDEFPILAGSHLHFTDPALELCKGVCHVFGMEPTIELQLSRMKKTLLRQLDVKEFSKESTFVDPCLSFVLPDVICAFCNYCCDIDLCRDPTFVHTIQEEEEDMSEGSAGPAASKRTIVWRCAQCQAPYDREDLEWRLVQMAERRSLKYQLQDLSCNKCKMTMPDSMSEYCKCSGAYVCDRAPEDMSKSLRTMRRLAAFHQLPLLQETVQWLLQSS